MFNYTATLSAAENWAGLIPRRPLWHNTDVEWQFEPVIQKTAGVLRLTLSAPDRPAKVKAVQIADVRDTANAQGSVMAVLDDIYMKMFEISGIPAPPLPVR
ncbi:hypothetical protein [Amycolatopsis decaplanina]|uniref:Uncharacterized protein n=1 Tax=Amycolatopsis decaplanina DSM 44594 TaxID=1284240 RepID=M2YUP7_9PSEU|nr:hypothetical protein [Amycolatopsis decaplanina]EME58602.1 hypothetical protein H074_18523 [Amycolatopsis decaplanina DSM 44594]